MPWQEVSVMSSRKEFVTLARQEGANVRALCRRFGISPKTGYKLLARHAESGDAGLEDRPRRPKTSPGRTPAAAVNLRHIGATDFRRNGATWNCLIRGSNGD